MRLLKTLGLIVLCGVYVYLITLIPLKVMTWLLIGFFTVVIFLYGYFILFNPKK